MKANGLRRALRSWSPVLILALLACSRPVDACEGLRDSLEKLHTRRELSPEGLRTEVHTLADAQSSLSCARLALEGGSNLQVMRAGELPGLTLRLLELADVPGSGVHAAREEGLEVAQALLEAAVRLEPEPATATKLATLLGLRLAGRPQIGPRDAEALAQMWTWTLYRAQLHNRFDPQPDENQRLAARGGLQTALTLLFAPSSPDSGIELDEPAWTALVVLARLAVERIAALEEDDWLKALRTREKPSREDRLLLEEYRSWRHWAWRLTARPGIEGRQVAGALLARILIWNLFQPSELTREMLPEPRQALPFEVEMRKWIQAESPELRRQLERVLVRLNALAQDSVAGIESGSARIFYRGLPPYLAAPLAAMEAQLRLLPSDEDPSIDAAPGSSADSGDPAAAGDAEDKQQAAEFLSAIQVLKLAVIAHQMALEHAGDSSAHPLVAGSEGRTSPLSQQSPALFGWYHADDVLNEAVQFVGALILGAERASAARMFEQALPLLLEIKLPLPDKTELLLDASRRHADPRMRTRARLTVLEDSVASFRLQSTTLHELIGQVRRYLTAYEALQSDRLDASGPLASSLPSLTRSAVLGSAEVINRIDTKTITQDNPIGRNGCADVLEIVERLKRLSLRDPQWRAVEANFEALNVSEDSSQAFCEEPTGEDQIFNSLGCAFPSNVEGLCDPPLEVKLRALKDWLETVSEIWYANSGAPGRLGLIYPSRLLLAGLEETQALSAPLVLSSELRQALLTTLAQGSCALLAAEGPRTAAQIGELARSLGAELNTRTLCGAQAGIGRLVPLRLSLTDLPLPQRTVLEPESLRMDTPAGCRNVSDIDPDRPESWQNAIPRLERCEVASWLTGVLQRDLAVTDPEYSAPWRLSFAATQMESETIEAVSPLRWEEPAAVKSRSASTRTWILPVPDLPAEFSFVWRTRACRVEATTLSNGKMKLGPQGSCENGVPNETRESMRGGVLQ